MAINKATAALLILILSSRAISKIPEIKIIGIKINIEHPYLSFFLSKTITFSNSRRKTE
jgi:hypothetical protein